MWENRCKVAVSGVGFSKVTRSADIPLAAHALTAVKEAVADSGLQMSDIDGLATKACHRRRSAYGRPRPAVKHPRWEPYAGKLHVRFCAGGAQ
jgi:hypothetical protein